MTLLNDKPKAITAVEWDFVITDPRQHAEIARHRFYSQEKVAPNKRKTIIAYSTSPPTKVITVAALTSQPYLEMVIIRRILYADGVVWTAPNEPDSMTSIRKE